MLYEYFLSIQKINNNNGGFFTEEIENIIPVNIKYNGYIIN